MPRKRRAEPCGHPGQHAKGGCKTCHSMRTRAYHAAYRRDERRRARDKREEERRARDARTVARLACASPSSLTARQLYALEKAKRVAAGKPVLKPYCSIHWEDVA